jgi:hypothetical protein
MQGYRQIKQGQGKREKYTDRESKKRNREHLTFGSGRDMQTDGEMSRIIITFYSKNGKKIELLRDRAREKRERNGGMR